MKQRKGHLLWNYLMLAWQQKDCLDDRVPGRHWGWEALFSFQWWQDVYRHDCHMSAGLTLYQTLWDLCKDSLEHITKASLDSLALGWSWSFFFFYSAGMIDLYVFKSPQAEDAKHLSVVFKCRHALMLWDAYCELWETITVLSPAVWCPCVLSWGDGFATLDRKLNRKADHWSFHLCLQGHMQLCESGLPTGEIPKYSAFGPYQCFCLWLSLIFHCILCDIFLKMCIYLTLPSSGCFVQDLYVFAAVKEAF